jgi:hypothetical protein
MRGNQHPAGSNKKISGTWKAFGLVSIIILLAWVAYVNFHPTSHSIHSEVNSGVLSTAIIAHNAKQQSMPVLDLSNEVSHQKPAVVEKPQVVANSQFSFPSLPVLGPVPTNGVQPLFGVKHKGTDAIFALACNYPKVYYQRFVGSLRKFGYNEDIVLAVSPEVKMKPGVKEYLQQTNVVAYGFEVDCQGVDNCKLKDDFLGYPDPRPMRTFANIRYALYEYWLRHYTEQSYILILDFRDTFFQANPFQSFGNYGVRQPKYELHMYAENYDVKNIGICVFNSNWIKTCFGKDALDALRKEAVICSGSTLGSYPAVHHYVRTMLSSMDTVKCWLKGIESDQGYQNYLFYNGYFNTKHGNATLFHQGHGVVNTIGAMNGFRVPKEKKGPLDTFWKIRDPEGFVLNYDHTRSACVHQWDRWHDELVRFIDTKVYDK